MDAGQLRPEKYDNPTKFHKGENEMEIEITEAHILNGSPGAATECPVALALLDSEELNAAEVYVDPTYVTYRTPYTEDYLNLNCDMSLEKLIRDYDELHTMNPGTLTFTAGADIAYSEKDVN